ncbi:PadR family transcriptional regulator [Microbacterium timonense]|uniref:PadR family transcriptional regulator n=1 Tax=Microbacterium timonense TaxID=2086576 RepID=UPI00135C9351|nr:PadR family transcriptional regulator [Microbacterium timonense]
MQYVILGLLMSGPLSLYDVQKRFTAGISLFYSASSGSIQRALQHLAADGYASIADPDGSRRGRKLYVITDSGRDSWRSWMLGPVPDGTEAETTVLARVFLLGQLADQSDRADVVRAVRAHVDRSSETLRSLARDLDGRAASLEGHEREVYSFQRMTLDYGIRAHGLLRAWIDEVGEQA